MTLGRTNRIYRPLVGIDDMIDGRRSSNNVVAPGAIYDVIEQARIKSGGWVRRQ